MLSTFNRLLSEAILTANAVAAMACEALNM